MFPMSGFRSRFPTVTPWTTDQDLPDIVFRPCFTSVVSEFVPGPSGCAAGAPKWRGPGAACRPAASPLRGGADQARTADVAASLALPQVTEHDERPAGPSPARTVNRRTGDHAPMTTIRRDHPLAFRTARRASSPSRPGRRPTPPLISHSHPTGSDRAAGPAALHVTGTPGRQDGLVTDGSRAGTAVATADSASGPTA
jgi:hypothetical protein